MKWVCVLVLVTGCFISPVYRFGGGKTKQQAQQDQAARMTPPGLSVEDEFKGPIRRERIRVYADDDHRAQNVHWQQTFQETLVHANEILKAEFGIELSAEYQAWSYRAEPGTPLDQELIALATMDPGSDVFAVVALTSKLSLVSATFDQLGVGRLPGKHIVIRGYDDHGERAAFDFAFKELTTDQRDHLYLARRRHKTVSLFLHELGHNLGANHRGTADTLMAPIYSNASTSFDSVSHDSMMATIDARLGRASKPSAVVPPADAHPVLVIVVDETGAYNVGGNLVDEATLDGLFKLHAADDKDTSLVIKTRKAPAGVAGKLIDRAKAAGLSRVTVSAD